MEVEMDKMLVTVIYKGKRYTAEVPVDATVGLLGKQLSQLTGVVLSTMRLLVPKGKRSIRGAGAAIEPASELHSSSSLDASGITPGILIRMMGATSEELKEVMQPVKEDRVLGFAEEDARRRLRWQVATQVDAKSRLPKGPYTFQDFRTLELPFIVLTPSPEKARALMYRLASDPGIVGIMNKHKWQVGIMTELAPEGHVGISPKCILGYNKNRGQEISLRLRTDDLQGFRKYASIKKTLLHELAHMVHDEHDENFHALDKQLNQEAIELDWTNTTGRTLSGVAIRDVEDDDEPMDAGGVKSGHKLGGGLPPTANARKAAVQAALTRFEQNKLASDSSKIDPFETVIPVGTLSIRLPSSRPDVENLNEPDPDEIAEADEIVIITEGTELDGRRPTDNQNGRTEPDPDESTSRASVHSPLPVLREREPDPDDSQAKPGLEGCNISGGFQEPDPDDMLTKTTQPDKSTNVAVEPDPDESMHREEPDPDDSMDRVEPDPDESMDSEEPDPDESVKAHENGHGLDLGAVDEEIARIQDATASAVTRLQHAVMQIRHQATPAEITAALKSLSTIVSNVINNPNDDKYKLLRKVLSLRAAIRDESVFSIGKLNKGNPRFQDRVGRFEGAVEFLQVVGFSEGECAPGAGGTGCFVLKTSDPGLLWLARGILEPLLA